MLQTVVGIPMKVHRERKNSKENTGAHEMFNSRQMID